MAYYLDEKQNSLAFIKTNAVSFHRIIKEYKQKMGTLKRSQQMEKKKSAHLLEEARKREGDLNEDASQLKV